MTGEQLEALSYAAQDYLKAQEEEAIAAKAKEAARTTIMGWLATVDQREVEVGSVSIKVSTCLNQTLPLKLVLAQFPEAARLVQEKAVVTLSVRRKGE